MKAMQILLIGIPFYFAAAALRVPIFSDLVNKSGLVPGPYLAYKWGGPCIADLDNDGHYDIILWYHFYRPLEIFFGGPGGKFTKSSFRMQNDIHGVTVSPISTKTRSRFLSITPGGGRGTHLRPPHNFIVSPDRKFRNITLRRGLGKDVGRGRTQLFLDLSFKSRKAKIANGGGPDHLVFNFLENPRGRSQWGYEFRNGRWRFRRVPGLEKNEEARTELSDINGDGRMNLFMYPTLKVYENPSPFKFKDITAKVLPNPDLNRTVAGVAEFDMDNDGDMDLYIARTHRTDFLPDRFSIPYDGSFRDILLRNDNGRYVDVTRGSGIAGQVRSLSVTTGDFDNNGYVDLFISIKYGADIMLLNRGNGKFQRVYRPVPKKRNHRGNHAVAVDLDLDGRVDLCVGQGGHIKFGPFRIMRNVSPRGRRHYLLVKVGNDPKGASTSLHAVVHLFTGRLKMTRRVGSRGSTDGGSSFLDTVHFGLGRRDRIREVRVTWSSGIVKRVRNVAVDQKIQIGKF